MLLQARCREVAHQAGSIEINQEWNNIQSKSS